MFWNPVVVIIAQLCKYTKSHWIIHFRWANCMVCEFYLSKAIFKTQKKKGILSVFETYLLLQIQSHYLRRKIKNEYEHVSQNLILPNSKISYQKSNCDIHSQIVPFLIFLEIQQFILIYLFCTFLQIKIPWIHNLYLIIFVAHSENTQVLCTKWKSINVIK